MGSSSLKSITNHTWSYDVFVSYEGGDIIQSFVDHLFRDFIRKGIRAFKEDDHVCRGEERSPQVFRAIEQSRFLVVILSDGFASSPSCLFKKVDSRVFPISIHLCTGGVLEKDPAPHLTARQEQAIQVLSSNKAPFRRYPECCLALVGLNPYYPFGENTYPAFERPDGTDMGLLDYIRTADPRKVQAVEVQKGEEQVTLFDSTKQCFVSLDAPAAVQQASGSGSGTGAAVSALSAEENVVEENVISEGTFLDLTDPEGDVAGVERDVAQKQPEKAKRKKLLKQSDPLPAKRLRVDHPSLASGTGGKTLASLRWTIPEGTLLLGPSSPADVHTQVTVQSSRVVDAPVYTTADTVTSSRGKTLVVPTSDVGGSSHPETSEEPADSFYEMTVLNSEDAKRWLKSLVQEKETESAEVLRLRHQVFVLAVDKSSLSSEVSALKSDVSQKDTIISLLDSRSSHLKSSLDDSQAACDEARNLISSLSSKRGGLVSEVSILRSAFRDFKDKMEAQQEAQAQELYNRVAELEAYVMDVSGCLEGEFYPAYLTALAGRRWLLTHGVELAMIKCLGHALGRAVDYGMQEGLAAGHEHGVAGTPFSAVVAYNPETAEGDYLDAVRALKEADFPLVRLLKSKKDSGMDEVLDCFLLDGPLADLPKAAHLQPCLEQLSVPIYHADVNAVVGETSLSFALRNVHNRAEGARKHAAALRRLMVDIVFHPLSSQNLLGEASTSAVAFCVEDLDTD
ncbi:gypsy type transposase [Tanacetum coccineum]